VEAAVTKADKRLTFSVDEAAKLLGISRNSAFRAVQTGELPSIRIGRRILIPRDRLRALVESGS
jgi:excisionase family DNA binding protein